MENEIVKYNNDFNNQALRSFTAEELNLLITLFHKLKEKGTNIFEKDNTNTREAVLK